MKKTDRKSFGVGTDPGRSPRWPWAFAGCCLAVLLIAYCLRRTAFTTSGHADGGTRGKTVADAAGPAGTAKVFRLPHGHSAPAPALTAEEVVAKKLGQFGHSRRELMHALARRANVPVPAGVERFFDAVESGNWDDIKARYDEINGGDGSATTLTDARPADLRPLWPAILDAYGAAEQVHKWPAQELLDYGQSVLGSLRPGMAYVGGTDAGRWVPELLNDTGDGENHVIITQNALADSSYLDYLNTQYGDRITTLTQEDQQQAFQDYVADAQKRLLHDQQFPDEPKQVLPGENNTMVDGKLQISGQTAVMAINERLLQTFMQNNPDLSFGLQESIPLKSTYADAAPLGPIMELRAADGSAGITPDIASQSLDYWRATTQQVLGDPATPDGSDAREAYAKLADAQANLLATHNYSAEAEQAYQLALQLAPDSSEATHGLAQLFSQTGRADQASQLLANFARQYPAKAAALPASH